MKVRTINSDLNKSAVEALTKITKFFQDKYSGTKFSFRINKEWQLGNDYLPGGGAITIRDNSPVTPMAIISFSYQALRSNDHPLIQYFIDMRIETKDSGMAFSLDGTTSLHIFVPKNDPEILTKIINSEIEICFPIISKIKNNYNIPIEQAAAWSVSEVRTLLLMFRLTTSGHLSKRPTSTQDKQDETGIYSLPLELIHLIASFLTTSKSTEKDISILHAAMFSQKIISIKKGFFGENGIFSSKNHQISHGSNLNEVDKNIKKTQVNPKITVNELPSCSCTIC